MSNFLLSDLAALGTPEIIEQIDYPIILAGRKASFKALMAAGGVDYDVDPIETDPGVILLEESSEKEVILRQRGNDIALQRYLYFAAGVAVDHLGAFYDCPRMVGELDPRYKSRIVLAIQARSTGGTPARYKLIALSTSLDVADAYVYTTRLSPIVNIAVFSTDPTGVASADLLAAVTAAIEDDAVRMVNDRFNIVSAVVEVVNVAASMLLLPNTPQTILTPLAAPLPALTGLQAQWQAVGGLGRDLTLDWLKGALMVSGVYSATITLPVAPAVMQPYQAVRIGTVSLIYAGTAY